MTKKLEYVEPKSYFPPSALKIAREFDANKAREVRPPCFCATKSISFL